MSQANVTGEASYFPPSGSLAHPMNDSLANTSLSDSATLQPWPLLRKSTILVVILSVAYILVFVLGVVNNSFVVSVIYRTPQMRNVTNYFLANLAIADLTVSFIVLPITLLNNLFTEWVFGAFLCKSIPYLQAVAVSASVNTLAAVAIERYFAIFYPQKMLITPRRAIIIICLVWLIPMAIQLPWPIAYTHYVYTNPRYAGTLTLCTAVFSSADFERGFFLGVVFLSCYLVPLCFICICYSLIGIKVWKRSVAGIRGSKTERNIHRSKIRIVRMLIVVACFFGSSWLPLYSIRMRILYGPTMDSEEKKLIWTVTPFAQWLSSANSCVNPFIYCYFSEQFRRGILGLLKSRSCCGRISV